MFRHIQKLKTSLEFAHGKLESQNELLRDNGNKLKKQQESSTKYGETLDGMRKQWTIWKNQSWRSNNIAILVQSHLPVKLYSDFMLNGVEALWGKVYLSNLKSIVVGCCY